MAMNITIGALILAGALHPANPCASELQTPACDNSNVYDGYWWREKRWIPGMIDLQSWFRPAPLYSKGNAVYYAPQIMEATAAYRNFHLSGFVDGVALMSPADIGKTVWIRRKGYEWEGPFLVVDCARHNDHWPIVKFRREVIEVGFSTAIRWGMAKIGGDGGKKWTALKWVEPDVEVSKINPIALGQNIVPIDYPDWWLEHARFTISRQPKPIFVPPDEWQIGGMTKDQYFGETEMVSRMEYRKMRFESWGIQ